MTTTLEEIDKDIDKTFLKYAWGNPAADDFYRKTLTLAENLGWKARHFVDKLEVAASDGRNAHKLVKELKARRARGEKNSDIAAWVDHISKNIPKRVLYSVEREIKNSNDFKKTKQELRRKDIDFRISIPDASSVSGIHPQSLRSLKPSRRWQILIDETGANFSADARNLNEFDTELGRVIALALPEGNQLPKIGKASHGVDLKYSEIEELFRRMLRSNIGLLGATVKEDLNSNSWLAAVSKLARWVLLTLPISGPTEVAFKIEQRDDYEGGKSLEGYDEIVSDDLKKLYPERYKDLVLSFEFVGKDDVYNGYVDAVANCWGSGDKTKKQLLARTGWPGHCLLSATDLAEVDRLYKSADSGFKPALWFEVCKHLTKEPGFSIFNDLLIQLGSQAKQKPELWRSYLNVVRDRIANKTFDAGSLSRALGWLEANKPPGEEITGVVELQLKSAKVAAENHGGHYDSSELVEVMALAERLKEESAQDACEAVLRVASSATNVYDFESLVPYLEQWLSEPIAVPGRLNYGKLLSSLGQLSAFQRQNEAAIAYFDKAVEHFECLSDPLAIEKNVRQTQIYKAITLLDQGSADSWLLISGIINQATGKKGTISVRVLARSESPYRFEHHLFLRSLFYCPDESEARNAYLSCREEWQYGEGHPWMLINAYRASLLHGIGLVEESQELMQQAIDECDGSGASAVLRWIGQCLFAWGKSLELQLEPPFGVSPGRPFPLESLSVLEGARDDQARVEALKKALPFNFH